MPSFTRGRAWLAPALLVAAALAIPVRAHAQAADPIEDEYETWLGVFAAGPIAGDLWTHSDVHYRAYDDGSPHWALARPGLSYRVMDGMFVTVGYAWTPSWGGRGAARFTDEHRAWEQWLWDLTDAGTGIKGQVRVRLEERFRSDREVGMRARAMARLSVPLTTDRALLAVAWDELFVMLNDTTVTTYQHAGFDQNRVFVGLGYQVVPGVLRFELGYFQQLIRRPNNDLGDLMNHTAMLNTYIGWR